MTEIVFCVIGGLALFLFGMVTLSEGLKKAASNRLRTILEKSTGSPFRGLIVGTTVTCLIQSSSAVTALLVGFVNAGLLSLRQAIGIVLGANIGTTFTAWIVSLIAVLALLKITHYTLPFIALGLVMMHFFRATKVQSYGKGLFGFGMLLLGLSFLKDASDLLKDMGIFEQWFANVSPLSAIFVGLVACWILQSSSATIAIVQILAFQGMISLDVALGLALGADMGTPITAEIAALTGNQAARQSARSHTLFNFFGPIYLIPLLGFGIWPRFIESVIPGPVTPANIMVHVAVAHSIYNTFNAFLFLPLVGFLEKASIKATHFTDGIGHRIVTFLTRGTREWPHKEFAFSAFHFDDRVLEMPDVALETVIQGMVNMLRLGQEAVQKAMQALFERNPGLIKEVLAREDTIDVFQKELTESLAKLIRKNLPTEISEEIPILIHSINDIEKIGDYAEDMAYITGRCLEENINFGEATNELKMILDEANDMADQVTEALRNNDGALASRSLNRETNIDKDYETFRKENIKRLGSGTLSVVASVYFLDFLTKFEKMGDHLTNIAQGIMKFHPEIKSVEHD